MTHTSSGSAPLVTPTACSLTPSGRGLGWSTWSALSTVRTISCTATKDVYRVSNPYVRPSDVMRST